MKKRTYKIEIYQVPVTGKCRQTWRFRVVASNGKIIAHGERYSSPGAIERTIYAFLGGLVGGRVEFKMVKE